MERGASEGMAQAAPHCPVCMRMIREDYVQSRGDRLQVSCVRCGEFEISRTAKVGARKLASDPIATAKVCFALRKMQEHARFPLLNDSVLNRILMEAEIPSPREQADNLILWLGRQLRDSGPQSGLELDPDACSAVMGAVGFEGTKYILTHLGDQRLIDARPKSGHEGNPWHIGLRFEGWDRFYELERQIVESRVAFMAMPFGDSQLDRIFRECFKPAVKKAGFDLRRVDEEAPAGLIDNRLRVEIRRARFLIAELTGSNAGAYWEAGFAEGLGRPVIYTCEQSYFRERKTHFDTNHSLTIVWSGDAMEKAAKDLTATIRATLPAEAIPPSEEEET